MGANRSINASKPAHYRAWNEAWLVVEPSKLPAEECSSIIAEEGPQWLLEPDVTAVEQIDRIHKIVACFKTAAKARLILLGGKVPPSCDECDVLSESYDTRVACDCSGLFPVPSTLDAAGLGSCGCRAIERMTAEAKLANSKEDEWNSSIFFSSKGLSSATTELALCHADIQPPPFSCYGEQGRPDWDQVQAPDRKPKPDMDLDEEVYRSLYPTENAFG